MAGEDLPGGHERVLDADLTHNLSLRTIVLRELDTDRQRLEACQDNLAEIRKQARTRVFQPLAEALRSQHPDARPEGFLEVVGGWQAGETFALPRGRVLLLGRDQQADIVLRDTIVSRAHCKLENVDSWTYRIKDLGSQNGTRLNRHTISAAELQGGDLLSLGWTFMIFSLPLVSLAVRLQEHSLLDERELQDLLRLEGCLHHLQVGIARVCHGFWALEHSDSAALPAHEMAVKSHEFRQDAARVMDGLEAELPSAEAILQPLLDTIARKPAPQPLPSSGVHPLVSEPPAAQGTAQRELYEARSYTLDLERRHRQLIELLLAQAEALGQAGEAARAVELLRRLLLVEPATRKGQELLKRWQE